MKSLNGTRIHYELEAQKHRLAKIGADSIASYSGTKYSPYEIALQIVTRTMQETIKIIYNEEHNAIRSTKKNTDDEPGPGAA